MSYGMISNAGPQRTTHKGWHLRELRIGKKRMRREARKAIKRDYQRQEDGGCLACMGWGCPVCNFTGGY